MNPDSIQGQSEDDPPTIHLCSDSEIADVMRYIEENWMAGHIMAHSKRLVDFQHRNPHGGYHFIVYGNRAKITALLGFIPTSQYDPALLPEKAVWPAIWKNTGDPGDGLGLIEKLISQYDFVGSIGINPKVAKLYRVLGFTLGELTHYYILNRETSDFRIALLTAPPAETEATDDEAGADLRAVGPDELLNSNVKGVYLPLKTGRFFVNRYLRHPYYEYKVYGVINKKETEIRAFLAVRAIEVNGSRCLRIVDALGDLAACGCLNGALQKLMQDENAEYTDLMNYGLPEDLFRRHGFLVSDAEHIIPNYFEPFVRENIRIRFAVLNKTPRPFVVFKGDSDQDRPNRIPAGGE